MSANDTLIYLKELLCLSLDEISNECKENQFCNGERTAYVECLEALQLCESATRLGLDFNIEKRYPLD